MNKFLKFGGFGCLGLIILGIIISASSGSNTNNGNNVIKNDSQPTEAIEKQWVKVYEAEGTSTKKTDSFELKGGKQRITYTFTGNDPMLGIIHILKEGTTKEQGSIYEVMTQKAGTDETISRKSAGTYYLDVTSANATWDIRVEEEQ